MRTTIRRTLLSWAILCAAVACGSDSTSPPPVDLSLVGTYTLRTVNGSGLPFVILQSGQTSVSVTEGRITIADGGSWSETANLRTTANGQVSNQAYADNGTWLRSGNGIALSSAPNRNTAYSGTFTSNQLILNDGTFNSVYQR